MPQVYVVHGYTASPEHHWFKWLEVQLAQFNIDCTRLAMPDSSAPTPKAWVEHLQKHAPIDEQTIFVAHSLGCIATLCHLAQAQKQPLGCVFVSGFYQPLAGLPELTPFAKFYETLPACLPLKAYTIASFNDAVVPHHYTESLAEHLHADYIRLKTGGHFLMREGCTEFPLVLSLVKQLCNLGDFGL